MTPREQAAPSLEMQADRWLRDSAISFSQITSTELVDADEIELCDAMPSTEKTEDEDEEADEAREALYG